MPNDDRYATVHYRKLVRNGGWNHHASLSDAIQAALGAQRGGVRLIDDWELRLTIAPGDSSQQRFINDSHLGVDYVFANLCAYATNEMQSVVSTNVRGPSVAISDLAPPGGTDYLHGIAYWLAVGDHCYVVQHTRVRTKALEEYLTWLLRDATATITDVVVLQATFGAEIDLGEIKAVEIGGVAPETVPDSDTGEPNVDVRQTDRVAATRRSLGERLAPLSRARELLEAVFGPVGTEELLRRVPSEAALQVKLMISYLSKSRVVDRAPLRDIGIAVRNLDDGEVRVHGKNGSVTRGAAQLHETVRFRRMRDNGNLLDLEDVHNKLLDLHLRFMESGRISD